MYTIKNYYDRSYSIWDRRINAKITEELDNNIDNPESTALYDLFDDIIAIHYTRQKIAKGMFKRTKLDRASFFEWDDPREADGVPIFARQSPGVTKENHKLHTAFDKKIITNKSAYIAGNSPEIMGDDPIKDYYTNNDISTKTMELLQSSTRSGNGYWLVNSPEGENEVYLTLLDEWECLSFYDSKTQDLKYSIRYWCDVDLDNTTKTYNDDLFLDLYTEDRKYSYVYNGSWQLLGETDHLMSGVPLVEFPNNTERIGDVELTTSLQDAYDILNSDLSSEITQLRLAYLVMKSDSVDIDDEFITELKKTGIWSLEKDGDVSFIEKTLQSQAIENLKTDLERQIYEYSNSYNPNELGRDAALTAFQIRQKLFGLEMSSAETIKMYEKAMNYTFMLISEYLKRFKNQSISEDFKIVFKRNIPSNIIEDVNKAVMSGFKISQDVMASLMPFEIDQEENKRLLAEEAAALIQDFDAGDGDILAAGGDVEEAVEVAKLSGIQISSANDIIGSVSRGEITREAGINQLKVFLGLSDEQANQVMGAQTTIKTATIPDEEE